MLGGRAGARNRGVDEQLRKFFLSREVAGFLYVIGTSVDGREEEERCYDLWVDTPFFSLGCGLFARKRNFHVTAKIFRLLAALRGS